ncbi:MAG: DUF4336 domain-containing protein [Cyanobacteria bacterium J06639_1]
MPLTAIAPGLWTATQPLRFMGLEVGSRMTVVRLPSGALALISPIKLSDRDCAEIDELGSVGHIIAPNLFHHLSVGSTKERYPEAIVWGVDGLSEKRPDLSFDAALSQPGSLEGAIDYLQFEGFAVTLPGGIKLVRETVFCHRPSRTLIVTDIAFNFDRHSSLGVQLAARAFGFYEVLRPTLMEKWGTRDKAAVERSARQVLAWDFDRVIPGHGSVIETGGQAQFQAGYEWFLDKSLTAQTTNSVASV